MPVLRVVLFAALLSLLGTAAAQAAPVGALKQYKVPTANSQPRAIANGSDGNRWFTEGTDSVPSAIARITPAGAVTEFRPACNGCIVTDIAQGPGDVLFFTSNDPFLGRITTSGQFLDPIPMPDSNAVAGNLAIHGSQVWITDFNNDVLWRYDGATGQFTQFPVSEPADVVVDAAGAVWFTAPNDNAIGRLDPATGAVTLTHTEGFPRELTIAADGQIWFTERFVPEAVGRLNPVTGAVTLFPVADTTGPEGIAASPDGSVWFTQTTKGNVARITNDGTITEGKAVKGSQPFGIAVDPQGDPWYTMLSANKIAELQLR
jgi:virginiamycin B lyase